MESSIPIAHQLSNQQQFNWLFFVEYWQQKWDSMGPGRLSNKLVCNYQNPLDGKVYNSGFKEYDGSLMLGVNKNWGHTHLTISSYNTLINLVEGERDSLGKFTFLDALRNYENGFRCRFERL